MVIMEWIQQILNDKLLYRGAIACLILLGFYLSSIFSKRLVGWLARKFFAKTETQLDDLIVEVVRRNVKSLVIVTGVHLALRELRKGIVATDETLHQILDYADALVYVIVVIIIVKITLNVVRVLVDWYLDQLSQTGTGQLKMTLGPLTSKIVNILIGMVAFIIVLDHFGINIGSLLVSLGVGSLAVALAAQDTLANMIAGFVLLIDRPFGVGDRIELPTGEVGDIQLIGLRSTKILNFDNNLVIVPNAELVKTRIINHAYPFHQMRARVKVGVAYGTDPERVRRILLDIANTHPHILKDPEPLVHFTAMGDSAIEFTLFARASDYSVRFATENEIRETAYNTFTKEGIEIPFPQRVVHMKTDH